MATLVHQEGAVASVLLIRLLLALGLRRSPHVRVMPGTTVTLHQAHAAHARLADTRLLAVTEVSRMMSALRVQRTRLPMPLGLQRSPHVHVMPGTTVTLHQAHAVRARLAGTRVRHLRTVTRRLCAMRV